MRRFRVEERGGARFMLDLCGCRPEMDAETDKLFESFLERDPRDHVGQCYTAGCTDCLRPTILIWPAMKPLAIVMWEYRERLEAKLSPEAKA